MINEKMTPMQVLKVISGLCKTNSKANWDILLLESKVEDEFKFLANMIDSYVEEQDKGSEGANQ
jgi:hypothetical protein